MSHAEHETATYETPYLDAAVAVFALLAHPVRVQIILALHSAEMSAVLLADIVDLPLAQVRDELAALESAGIISRQSEDDRVFYQLANEHAGALASNAIFHAEHQASIRSHTPTT